MPTATVVLRSFGMTCLMWKAGIISFPVPITGEKNGVKFVDIFDKKEQAKLEAGVKFSCTKSRSNPNCIGYTWTDLGSWPLENPSGTNWVEFTRNLPADAPGRKAWEKFLSNWGGEDGNARDLAFLRLIAREYFRIVGEANRKYAPDQLVFGDRFAFNTIVPEVIKEMLPYVDAIAIQPPFQGEFPKAKYDEIHALTGKPILLCDFAVRFKDGDKDIRSWKPDGQFRCSRRAIRRLHPRRAGDGLHHRCLLVQPRRHPKRIWQSRSEAGIFWRRKCQSEPGLAEAVKEVNAWREQTTPAK